MFKNEKKLFKILLLFTFISFLITNIYYIKKQEKYEESIEYWSFNPSNSNVSKEEFVSLFVNNNITYSYSIYDTKKEDLTIDLDYIKTLLKEVYEKESIYDYIEIMTDWQIVDQEKSSFIYVVDYKPIVFNFISVSFREENGSLFEVIFEERTGTLLQNLIYINDIELMNQITKLDLAESINHYVENVLHLKSLNYMITIDEFKDKYYSIEFYVVPFSSSYIVEDNIR